MIPIIYLSLFCCLTGKILHTPSLPSDLLFYFSFVEHCLEHFMKTCEKSTEILCSLKVHIKDDVRLALSGLKNISGDDINRFLIENLGVDISVSRWYYLFSANDDGAKGLPVC